MTVEERDIIGLYGVPGVGAKTFARLAARFGSAGRVLAASGDELMTVPGVGPKLAHSIDAFDAAGFAERQRRLMDNAGAVAITRNDDRYPAPLKEFFSAPPVLFVRGDVRALGMTSIAFVGTRKPSSYGRKMTRRLVCETASSGICVVSGMAEGVDSEAHRAALDEGGSTVAVFGCGVDVIYPSVNRPLSEEIALSGCLVSHFPMGTRCSPGNFPARNAVIVGISIATVVVEAPRKSGALITAELAIRAGRRLFAVPGNADSPTCEGTNALFARGAEPVMSMETALASLGKKAAGRRAAQPVKPATSGLAGEIVTVLAEGPRHIEDIAGRLDVSTAEALGEMTLLEIDGYVRQLPGMRFELR
ncbi:MAG: DNA-processing protein DprA [Candidatus Latescibacteria bacterium]|nr:DNA-processing protein DprA [Candidatus Latescibacterota bacterium]